MNVLEMETYCEPIIDETTIDDNTSTEKCVDIYKDYTDDDWKDLENNY